MESGKHQQSDLLPAKILQLLLVFLDLHGTATYPDSLSPEWLAGRREVLVFEDLDEQPLLQYASMHSLLAKPAVTCAVLQEGPSNHLKFFDSLQVFVVLQTKAADQSQITVTARQRLLTNKAN